MRARVVKCLPRCPEVPYAGFKDPSRKTFPVAAQRRQVVFFRVRTIVCRTAAAVMRVEGRAIRTQRGTFLKRLAGHGAFGHQTWGAPGSQALWAAADQASITFYLSAGTARI